LAVKVYQQDAAISNEVLDSHLKSVLFLWRLISQKVQDETQRDFYNFGISNGNLRTGNATNYSAAVSFESNGFIFSSGTIVEKR
jgi:hypothetical protein